MLQIGNRKASSEIYRMIFKYPINSSILMHLIKSVVCISNHHPRIYLEKFGKENMDFYVHFFVE